MRFNDALRLAAGFLWLLIAAAALLFIADHYPPALLHKEIAGGILATVGTVSAGWLAWQAVQRQIASDDQRSQRRDVRRSAAVADAIANDVGLLAVELASYTLKVGLSEALGTVSQTLLIEATVIDPILGAMLSAAVVDIERFRQLQTSVGKEAANLDVDVNSTVLGLEETAHSTAFKLGLLQFAFNNAARMLGRTGHLEGPLLTTAELQDARRLYKPRSDDLDYLAALTQKPDYDNSAPIAAPPANISSSEQVASLLQTERSMGNLIHNEQIKLEAAFLNNLGVAAVAAGTILPIVSLSVATLPLIVVVVSFGLGAGLGMALLMTARGHLKQLKE
jgi:hypothetical protein